MAISTRPSNILIIADGKDIIILSSDYYGKQHSHIFKGVQLMSLEETHIPHWSEMEPSLSGRFSQEKIESMSERLTSDSTVEATLRFAAKQVVQQESNEPILKTIDLLDHFSVKQLFKAVNKKLKRREEKRG